MSPLHSLLHLCPLRHCHLLRPPAELQNVYISRERKREMKTKQIKNKGVKENKGKENKGKEKNMSEKEWKKEGEQERGGVGGEVGEQMYVKLNLASSHLRLYYNVMLYAGAFCAAYSFVRASSRVFLHVLCVLLMA